MSKKTTFTGTVGRTMAETKVCWQIHIARLHRIMIHHLSLQGVQIK